MNITKELLFDKIKDVNHPAINCSLAKLGIAKDFKISKEKITIILALPFDSVPENIINTMASSLVQPLMDLEILVDAEAVIMNEEEKATFLKLETENWKGLDE